MRSLSRVVWSEGMHLAQHHFQAQIRYFEDLTRFKVSSLYFGAYGLVACELDAEALLNGTVSLLHARGIMPDGLPFNFSEDALPQPLEIRDLFSPTHDSHLVLLGIPEYRPGQPNCAPAAAGAAPELRFTVATEQFADETTGQDEKPVAVARKNFRLLLDISEADGLVTLPLARVRRDGSGHFIYDPEYIPPLVQLGGSSRLVDRLGRLVDLLEAKADSMAVERSSGGGLAEYASREIAGFWLSHAIHSSLVPLRHLYQARTAHPEQLYNELSRLAGALCTFSLRSHPRDLPLYEHDDLDRCLGALERHIRDHLEVILPTGAVRLPVVRADEYLYTASVTDRRCLGRAHWFLGVRSSAGQGEVIARVPKLVKVCSAKHIVRLVQEAHSGLALAHVPAPPSTISPRVGTQYFRIETAGPWWESIVDTAQVGLYVPAAVPDAELELAVVIEE